MRHPEPSHISYHDAIERLGERLFPDDWSWRVRAAGGCLPTSREVVQAASDGLDLSSGYPADQEEDEDRSNIIRWVQTIGGFQDGLNSGGFKARIKTTAGQMISIEAGAFDEPVSVLLDAQRGTAAFVAQEEADTPLYDVRRVMAPGGIALKPDLLKLGPVYVDEASFDSWLNQQVAFSLSTALGQEKTVTKKPGRGRRRGPYFDKLVEFLRALEKPPAGAAEIEISLGDTRKSLEEYRLIELWYLFEKWAKRHSIDGYPGGLTAQRDAIKDAIAQIRAHESHR